MLLAVAAVAAAAGGLAAWHRAGAQRPPVVTVRRGTLIARLTVSGTLQPAESLTYRSPLGGRDAEIVELAPEGARVREGDLLVRLDTTGLQLDLERARQDLRQAATDRQLAEIERQDAEDDLRSVAEGDGAVVAEEARIKVLVAGSRVQRLRQEVASLQPLLAKGFITRAELNRAGDALEQAEQDLALARKRNDVLVSLTRPRDAQHARLQLAQKITRLENARQRAVEARARVERLGADIEACRIYARRPGLVVYEELLTVSPRRKIHVGDRVTGSQGLVTIPDVGRMQLDASLGEAEVHRVHPGQPVIVRVEAYADLRLPGAVARVGSLARASIDRPLDDKRFDVAIELAPTAVDLRPGMTARGDIVVGTRANVLLLPTGAVAERQGRFVTEVVGRSGLEIRPVDLGESNDAFVEVRAGLRDGEQVALGGPGAAGGTR